MSKKIKLKDGEIWSVISKPGDGFNRSGRRFTKKPILLTDEEITEAILNEPMLIVEKVNISGADPEEKKPEGDDPEGSEPDKTDPKKKDKDKK